MKINGMKINGRNLYEPVDHQFTKRPLFSLISFEESLYHFNLRSFSGHEEL
jgi:hypothetical protein